MKRNVFAVDSTARAIVQGLIRRGIKLLAVDFDLTMISLHTHGAWRGSVQQLAQQVRPCFRALMKAALETDVLHLCIVTYSPQQGMIRDLLRTVLPHSDTSRILIQTSSKDRQQKNQHSKQSSGKQRHIAQVVADLYNFRRVIIHPHEVLLMDDDDENVDIARCFGHVAFLVTKTVTLDDIYAFVEKIKGCEGVQLNPTARSPESFVAITNNSKYEPNEYKSAFLPKFGHSASVYLTSSNAEVPGLRQESGMSEKLLDGNFTVPRPTVVNEAVKRNPQVDMKVGRSGYDSSRSHSTTYVVMPNGQ